MNPH